MRQTITFIFLFLSFYTVSCNYENPPKKKQIQEPIKKDIITSYRVENTESTFRKILDDGNLSGHTRNLFAIKVLKQFYANRNYKPAWTEVKNIDDALLVIKEIEKDGLNPEDYHFSEIKRLADKFSINQPIDSIEFANFDVLLSDAIMVLAAHLISGKVNPEELKHQWEIETYDYSKRYSDAPQAFQEMLNKQEIIEKINSLKPTHYMYKGLKNALAEFKSYEINGGWDSISVGPTIKLGNKSERVIAVRQRLLASNEMKEYVPANDSIYDSILQNSMKVFQKKYGIESDGNVGKQTLYELNIPVEYRVEQIKANLERGRWVLYEIENKFIAVNIAGFELYFVEDDKEILTSKVIVGKEHTKSPIFKETMKYVVINPTWTVPRSLYAGYIKKLQDNPGYFAEKNMEVITTKGQNIPINGKDWSKYSVHNFPYMIRQKAGPNNALGYIKCMFPNKHSVYIHDTPARSLFNKDKRAFSHGCIRTQEIRTVAQLLLEPNNEGWTAEKIDKVIETRKTTTISLKERIPILILYWTAGIGFDQNFYFKPDVYSRDQVLIDALNAKYDY